MPRLCQACDITEADQVFDTMKIGEKIGELAQNQNDTMFLELFACTQMFSFLLENYLAAK